MGEKVNVKKVQDESYRVKLINYLNYRLILLEINELSNCRDILWVEDIIITPNKKPGIMENIKSIIQAISNGIRKKQYFKLMLGKVRN